METKPKNFQNLGKKLKEDDDFFDLAVEGHAKKKDYARERRRKIYNQSFPS